MFAAESKNAFLLVTGIFCAAFGIKGFLLSSHFIDGGVTGVSMLVAQLSGLPLGLLIFAINVPFIVIGYRQIGKNFALKTMLAILGLALVLFFVSFPDVTSDKLLTAVFGGLFIGAGIGLAIRGGGVLDGTEIAALLVSRKSHLLRVGDVILIFNVFIFLAAAIRNEEIKEAITIGLGRGVTVFRGTGGMGSKGLYEGDLPILFCVVTRLEIGNVKNTAVEIDPDAFITTHTLSDVEGGLIKRMPLHDTFH
jgi:uncharacterized membrane-anchored protein YitT (DUF2179 family)